MLSGVTVKQLFHLPTVFLVIVMIPYQYLLLILQLIAHRTSETRQKKKSLLLVVSRHTITATKVIIKECIIHTCYHCLHARFWLNIQAPIWPLIGVSASLSARLRRKDGQRPLETPRSERNLSMTKHNESTACELQQPCID